jgi:hypothetical protein
MNWSRESPISLAQATPALFDPIGDLAPPPVTPERYVLLPEAGFSFGVVPLVHELVCESIGDYYYLDQDQWRTRPQALSGKGAVVQWSHALALPAGFRPIALPRKSGERAFLFV